MGTFGIMGCYKAIEQMEKSKILFSNGIKISKKILNTVPVFLSPARFWRVYLCYVLLFMHGFLSPFYEDILFIQVNLPQPYSYIEGLSITTVIALIFFIITCRKGISAFKNKNYLLGWSTVLHLILVVIFAGIVADYGQLIISLIKKSIDPYGEIL